MKTNKISVIFASVGIIMLVVLMIAATYAYFSLDIEGEGKDINIATFNKNIQITYVDTSNVSMVNAYTGESISKTFTVENTGDVVAYYDIKLNDLVNNFADPDDLVFTLSGSNGGAIIKQTTMPVSNPIIASSVKINPGVKHSYIMDITFLRTEDDQSDNMNKTFSANINITSSAKYNPDSEIYENGTLGSEIVSNAIAETNIDYTTRQGEGVYYTNDSINGETIYFYRGSKNLNNNVLFAGKCFKILRTTIDGGIRLIYNGEATDGVCSDEVSGVLDNTSVFNSNTNYNAYVGYMYGAPNSGTYSEEHANVNSSTIKTVLENWYSTNISEYSSYIEDSIYCSNRKTNKVVVSNVTFGLEGYGNKNTGYLPYRNNSYERKPSYNCINKKDRLSVKNSNGVSALTYPVGLITVDELSFAGYNNSSLTTASDLEIFLDTGTNYWTMSPASYNGTGAYNYLAQSGNFRVYSVGNASGVRPVITLKKDTKILSGDGTLTTPYKITK